MMRSKTIQILVLALAIVVALDVTARVVASEEPVSLTDRLEVQPVDRGVYLLGNSMFKTGVDVEVVRDGLNPHDVRFGYYNGHYTSLWYLIAKGALGPSERRPELVVWGFRPGFALLPAYRQNQPNSTELFEFDDRAYLSLTGQSDNSPGLDVQSFMLRWSGMFAQRAEVQDLVSMTTEQAGLAALDVAGRSTRGLRERLVEGDGSIADEITRAATRGAVQLTEEQVVDGVGDFVTGPTLAFAEGFVPLTAESFEDNGLEQLVVIWRPASVAKGSPVALEQQFVSDAIDYFEDHDIPFLDLYNDERIDATMFAKGDHYNAAGRAYITDYLTAVIQELLPAD